MLEWIDASTDALSRSFPLSKNKIHPSAILLSLLYSLLTSLQRSLIDTNVTYKHTLQYNLM